MTGLVALTGSTGQLGGRVARRLAEREVEQRLVVRDIARAPDLPHAKAVVAGGYDDSPAMRAALSGVETLVLVSATEHPDRVGLHTAAVDAAAAAGVSRIIYTSFLGAAAEATFTFARDHFHTEQHIRTAGPAFVFLRNSLYLDFIESFVDDTGVIRGPAGDGRVAAVTRDDIADVAAAVVVDSTQDGSTFELTGPRAFTLAEAAGELTRVTGQPVTYQAETLEEAYASRAGHGAAEFEVAGWITSYAAIATGEMNVVTDAVERLTGHPPTGLPEYLAAHPRPAG